MALLKKITASLTQQQLHRNAAQKAAVLNNYNIIKKRAAFRVQKKKHIKLLFINRAVPQTSS